MSWLHVSIRCTRRPGDLKSEYRETLRGSGVTLEMIWRDMGPPSAGRSHGGELGHPKEHEMYSVFLEAKQAEIVVNGTPAVRAAVQNRQFFGRTMSTAFLAFSETWVTPEGGR